MVANNDNDYDDDDDDDEDKCEASITTAGQRMIDTAATDALVQSWASDLPAAAVLAPPTALAEWEKARVGWRRWVAECETCEYGWSEHDEDETYVYSASTRHEYDWQEAATSARGACVPACPRLRDSIGGPACGEGQQVVVERGHSKDGTSGGREFLDQEKEQIVGCNGDDGKNDDDHDSSVNQTPTKRKEDDRSSDPIEAKYRRMGMPAPPLPSTRSASLLSSAWS
ncbi:hypothetical protein DFH27DRAFT_617109 [Peziza echinospora]|nr:hypothetical protein DFH27DRAFT_617109 [Peziza echinospora]